MRRIFLIPILCVLLAGCSFSISPEGTDTPAALLFSTATLMSTFTPHPSTTPAPPTITPTVAPVEGTLSSQVNVRSGPDQAQTSLGLLNFATKVQIVGKDSAGKWWLILYKDAPAGVGWVSAPFVQVSGDTGSIPVVAAPDTLPSTTDGTAAATTAPLSPTPGARTATVTLKINVRSGPATTYDSLGMIAANTTVTLTGRNQINTWVQIDYPDGPDGKGWVAASYLQGADLNGLSYYDNDGNLIYASTPKADSGQPSPTPTPYAPAAPDGDSETNPAVQKTLQPGGASALIYSSELSAPTGDDADFVAFTMDGPANQSFYIYTRLDCIGNGGVTATLEKDGKPVPDTRQLVCGNYDLVMKVLGGQGYLLVLRADGSGGPLRYVQYTLTIKSSQ